MLNTHTLPFFSSLFQFKRNLRSELDATAKKAAKFVTLRLLPGQDLAAELEKLVLRLRCPAVNVVSCVGSVRAATLRLANADRPETAHNEVVSREEKFEIVSLTGTLEYSDTGDGGRVTRHLHLALADKSGAVWGGHILSCADGTDGTKGKALLPVFTTAEVCLLLQGDAVFSRKHCALSGWPELSIEPCC